MNLDLIAFYREALTDDDGRDLIAVEPRFLHLAVLGASDFFAFAGPLIRELVPEGTTADRLATEFGTFLINLVLDGIRKR